MKKAVLSLSIFAFSIIAASAASAAGKTKCDARAAIESFLRKGLAKGHNALDSIEKFQQKGNDYYVEYTYVGEDYMDSGMAMLTVNPATCAVKPTK